jgi:hypothetical protein
VIKILLQVPQVPIVRPELPVYIDQSMRYTDYLSIALTALAVLLAALAIFIGVAAVVGYSSIKDESRKVATAVAADAVTGFLDKIRTETKAILDDEIKKIREGTDFAESQPPQQGAPESGETASEGESVGERYPKDGEERQ